MGSGKQLGWCGRGHEQRGVDMSKERIIIRREYDPYRKAWGYLVGFPEQKANRGRICVVGCYFNRFNKLVLESMSEADKFYFLNKKLVHKNTEDADAVLHGLEWYYEEEFEVVEKIIKGMEAY